MPPLPTHPTSDTPERTSVNLDPANLDPETPTIPLLDLSAAIDKAKADAEAKADEPVTIADVAAAAFVALETLVNLLPDHLKTKVIDEFERRANEFRENAD